MSWWIAAGGPEWLCLENLASSAMHRRAEDLPSQQQQEDKQEDRPAEGTDVGAGGGPVDPQAEDQPQQHQDPIQEGEAHPLADSQSDPWCQIREAQAARLKAWRQSAGLPT